MARTASFPTHFLDTLPNHLIPPQQKQRLDRLNHHLDLLGRIDQESKEVFIDETALRHLIKDFAKQFPPGSEDQIIAALKALPGQKLAGPTDANYRRLKAVSWSDLGNTIPVFNQGSQTDTQMPRFSEASTVDDLKAELHRLVPDISDSTLEPDTFTKMIERASNSLVRPAGASGVTTAASVGDVFNCFVRKWGWWGAAIAVAVLIAVGTALGLVGPFTVIVAGITLGVVSGYAIAAIIAGGGAAAVMIMCILNPFG